MSPLRFTAAVGSQQDVLRVELERDRLRQQRARLVEQKAVAHADLAALLSRPAELVPEVAYSLTVDHQLEALERLLTLAESCNPAPARPCAADCP
ncbi:MAG: hypothetical protein KatS3mg111_0957 [Pirellulaceae bacterium]|nr:MAG: hypothetical protein KatS3mg111_0957 [Pirellulaceae bacterium]